ncbi:MAG: family 43 glycosylhydrolase, partial [Elusimicrobiota bacterium]
GQAARVRVNGREVGGFFEAYANPVRRFAEDSLWIPLAAQDCAQGSLAVASDASDSPNPYSEAGYRAVFFNLPQRTLALTQGTPLKVLDTTALDGAAYYVNDHTLVRGKDGKWHIFGIFHKEPFDPEHEYDFVHAVGPTASPGAWTQGAFAVDEKMALSRDASVGETHIWAPHVVADSGRFVMFYQGGGSDNDKAGMRAATSGDLGAWTRVGPKPVFEDICVARDPMVIRVKDRWVMYYTRCRDKESQLSGVAYRTSTDLSHWSEPAMALTITDSEPMFNSGYSESPFVFYKDGWYYLSVTAYPVSWDATFLYRSRTPFAFTEPAVARLRAHAPEWIVDERDGGVFMTHAGPGQGGVWVIPVSGF